MEIYIKITNILEEKNDNFEEYCINDLNNVDIEMKTRILIVKQNNIKKLLLIRYKRRNNNILPLVLLRLNYFIALGAGNKKGHADKHGLDER